MVPKKHKSKRQVASKKYKIVKKVNEHHRKQRKEAKLNPTKKLKKDPGVPNLFPFKEKLLQQAKEQSLAQMLMNAQDRGDKFEEEKKESFTADTVFNKDNSKKAFYKEFKKVVQESDVILEILDARDPLGCRTKQIEQEILSSASNKRIILVLNKIDLVPREATEAWLKYLRNEFPTVAFKASTQNQRSNLGQSQVSISKASESLLAGSECLGADNLIKLLKNYSRNLNIKTSITVGIVGFPNVGKSSIINSLKRSKVCGVGSTPGVTKNAQTIQLDKNIKLLDCPGIVFSKTTNEEESAQVLLRNCVKVELLEDPTLPVQVIVSKCTKEQLMQIYSVPYFTDSQDFLLHVARQRGKLKKKGVPDIFGAAKLVIQDWNQGKIPFYCMPPKTGLAVTSHIGSSIVSSWSKEFSLSDVVDSETLSSLKSKSELNTKMYNVTPSNPVPVDMDLEELPEGYQNEGSITEDEESAEAFSEVDMDEVNESEPEAIELMEESDNGSLNSEEGNQPKVPLMKSTKKFKAVSKDAVFTPEERAANPQHNQKAKKDMKKREKDLKRAMKQIKK